MTKPGPSESMQIALNLAKKHPTMTVIDICQIAGVSRTAFYAAKKKEPDRCPHCKRVMKRFS